MKYNSLTIYYFSGTGNARNAAQWMIDIAREKGLKTQLINIDRLKIIEAPIMEDRALIGFVSPTHGFNLPPIMLKFIRKFPRIRNADAFILNTRGGLKLYKFYLPGASGVAQIFPALLLRWKGLKIVGMQPLDLPSNWLILHPGLRKKVVSSIYTRCSKIVSTFSEHILSGKRSYKALYSLPIDMALIPIAIGYYFIGRFFLAKTLIATDACNQCERCVEQCPVESIKMVNNRPFWGLQCESCMRCVNSCPKRAIETTHTYTGLVVLLSSAIISPAILKGLSAIGFLDTLSQLSITHALLPVFNSLVFVGTVFLCYFVLHYMMRFRFINKFISYSSLSKYKFWRRYKPPKLRNFP